DGDAVIASIGVLSSIDSTLYRLRRRGRSRALPVEESTEDQRVLFDADVLERAHPETVVAHVAPHRQGFFLDLSHGLVLCLDLLERRGQFCASPRIRLTNVPLLLGVPRRPPEGLHVLVVHARQPRYEFGSRLFRSLPIRWFQRHVVERGKGSEFLEKCQCIKTHLEVKGHQLW